MGDDKLNQRQQPRILFEIDTVVVFPVTALRVQTKGAQRCVGVEPNQRERLASQLVQLVKACPLVNIVHAVLLLIHLQDYDAIEKLPDEIRADLVCIQTAGAGVCAVVSTVKPYRNARMALEEGLNRELVPLDFLLSSATRPAQVGLLPDLEQMT